MVALISIQCFGYQVGWKNSLLGLGVRIINYMEYSHLQILDCWTNQTL